MTIATPRLSLRHWQEEDLPAFATINADSRVMEFSASPLSRSDSDHLAGLIQAQIERDGFGLWAVEEKESASFIGFIGIAKPSFSAHFTPCVEIGWRLSSAYWGRGYATEGALAALSYGFTTLGESEIVSFTSTGNLASRRVMEKLGMQHDTRDDFDRESYAEGHPLRRHVLYRITRSQWQQDQEMP